jgi:hypothetical protein
MGKSKAEIQKAYRERKKLQEGETYLKKEREESKHIMCQYMKSHKERQKKGVKKFVNGFDNLG